MLTGTNVRLDNIIFYIQTHPMFHNWQSCRYVCTYSNSSDWIFAETLGTTFAFQGLLLLSFLYSQLVCVCVRHLLLLLLPPFESPAPPAAAAAEAAWLGGLSDWLSLVICVHSSHLHAFQICHFHFVHDGLRVKWEQVRWQHTALSHSSLSILIQPLLSSPILTTALCPQYRLVVIITLMKAVRILLSTPT